MVGRRNEKANGEDFHRGLHQFKTIVNMENAEARYWGIISRDVELLKSRNKDLGILKSRVNSFKTIKCRVENALLKKIVHVNNLPIF